MLTKRIECAQKKVEEFHFVNRKNVVKYDDVLNEQRKQVYARRQEILRGEDIRDSVLEWLWDVIEAAVDAHADGEYAEEWDWDGMWVALGSVYPIRDPAGRVRGRLDHAREELIEVIYNDAVEYYKERERPGREQPGAAARPRALDHAAGDRHPLARAPRQHGLHAPGHRPARLCPEGPAGGVPAARARRCSTR